MAEAQMVPETSTHSPFHHLELINNNNNNNNLLGIFSQSDSTAQVPYTKPTQTHENETQNKQRNNNNNNNNKYVVINVQA